MCSVLSSFILGCCLVKMCLNNMCAVNVFHTVLRTIKTCSVKMFHMKIFWEASSEKNCCGKMSPEDFHKIFYYYCVPLKLAWEKVSC